VRYSKLRVRKNTQFQSALNLSDLRLSQWEPEQILSSGTQRHLMLKRNSCRNERYICNSISSYNTSDSSLWLVVCNLIDCVLPPCRSKARWALSRKLISILLTTGLHLFTSTLNTLNFASISCLLAPMNNSCHLVRHLFLKNLGRQRVTKRQQC
jgi:hypothetical protein